MFIIPLIYVQRLINSPHLHYWTPSADCQLRDYVIHSGKRWMCIFSFYLFIYFCMYYSIVYSKQKSLNHPLKGMNHILSLLCSRLYNVFLYHSSSKSLQQNPTWSDPLCLSDFISFCSLPFLPHITPIWLPYHYSHIQVCSCLKIFPLDFFLLESPFPKPANYTLWLLLDSHSRTNQLVRHSLNTIKKVRSSSSWPGQSSLILFYFFSEHFHHLRWHLFIYLFKFVICLPVENNLTDSSRGFFLFTVVPPFL